MNRKRICTKSLVQLIANYLVKCPSHCQKSTKKKWHLHEQSIFIECTHQTLPGNSLLFIMTNRKHSWQWFVEPVKRHLLFRIFIHKSYFYQESTKWKHLAYALYIHPQRKQDICKSDICKNNSFFTLIVFRMKFSSQI